MAHAEPTSGWWSLAWASSRWRGTKEFVLRLHDELKEGDIRINAMRERFLTIGQAKVATSAYEAFELGYLREGMDEVVVNRRDQLAARPRPWRWRSQATPNRSSAKTSRDGQKVWASSTQGQQHGFWPLHLRADQLISEKLGTVMCGGDLSTRTEVSEQYLLDLERRAFLELCTKRKTLERMRKLDSKGQNPQELMDAYIVGGYRSAVAKHHVAGSRFMRADDLGEQVIRRLMSDFPQLDKERIDDVIVGNATPEANKVSTSATGFSSWVSTRKKCLA